MEGEDHQGLKGYTEVMEMYFNNKFLLKVDADKICHC